MSHNPLIVFTKPWPDKSLPELARFVKELGLDGVELPVRPGYQVTPENVAKGLKDAVRIFAEQGVKIGSVAGSTDEATIAAMGETGIKILRICVGIDMSIGYRASEEKVRRQFDALIPALDKHGVAIGVQNHCDFCVGSAIGIMHLIEQYDPRHVCAVLDMAHCAVDGEPEAMALDIVWSHLRLANFKSAFHRRINGPEAIEAKWAIHWTTCHQSGYSWSNLAALLKERGYAGDICLPAEYSVDTDSNAMLMGDDAAAMLRQDIVYIKQLLAYPASGAASGQTDWETGVGKTQAAAGKS